MSYENVQFQSSPGVVTAQVEIFSNGAVELRYGDVAIISSDFAAGIQDEIQDIRVPVTFAGCSTIGICTEAQSFPTNQGLHFSCKLFFFQDRIFISKDF